MADYALCFVAMLREESGLEQIPGQPLRRGPYSFMDHPDDPGGATMMGITHGVYRAWLARKGLPERDVRDIGDDEIMAIYEANYWQPIRGQELPAGVDLAVFDFAVNSGPSRAVKELQACLGVLVDGHMGDITLQAARSAEVEPLICDLMDRRARFCRSLRHYPSFKRGWEARFNRIERKALSLGAHGLFPTPVVLGLVSQQTPDAPTGGRAVEAPPRSGMIQSTTGQAAVTATTGGLVMIGMDAASALQKVIATTPLARGALVFSGAWLLELATRASFWTVLLAIVIPGAYIWFERKRKLMLEGGGQ